MAQGNSDWEAPKEEKSYKDRKEDSEENWTDEHGYPSYDFLKSISSIEKLRSIASDLDVNYGPTDSADELIDKIMEAEQDGPNVTN